MLLNCAEYRFQAEDEGWRVYDSTLSGNYVWMCSDQVERIFDVAEPWDSADEEILIIRVFPVQVSGSVAVTDVPSTDVHWFQVNGYGMEFDLSAGRELNALFKHFGVDILYVTAEGRE